MYDDFVRKLQTDEKILFYGKSDVTKTSKQVGRFLLGFIVLSFFWILFIVGLRNKNFLNFDILIIFITLLVITFCLLYGLIYNIFLKYKKINNEYFVTNRRIGMYNSKYGFRIENISNIEHIGIVREKYGYGDLMFNFYADNLVKQMKSGMSFEGIENPRKIVEMLNNLNKNIHIYDDKIEVIGKNI